MKLSEFILQPRGPYRFDRYVHPIAVVSPLGSFELEFHVANAAKQKPDEKMLQVVIGLWKDLEADPDSLVDLVHKQYLLATEDESWCEICELPLGLSKQELEPLLNARVITVSQDETDSDAANPGRIYMSPQWDEEHGLYIARIDGNWEHVDC